MDNRNRTGEPLYRLIDSDWDYLKRHSPAIAQFAGDWEGMMAWPDLSKASLRALRRHDKHALAELRKIDTHGYPEPAKLDYRLFERELLNRRREYSARAYLTHFWQFERFGPSPLRLLPYVASEPPATKPQQLRARVERLKVFDRYVDRQIGLMREAATRKMAPPAMLVNAAIRSLELELKAPPDKSAFYQSFAAAAGVDGAAVHLEAARDAIVTVVKPSLQRLVRFFSDDYLKRCPADVSLAKWPGGPSLYRLLLRLAITAESSPEEIHQTGLAEVARILAEMDGAMRAAGYTGTLAEFVASLRDSKRFYFASERELTDAYRVTAELATARVSTLFHSVPAVPPIAARRFGASGPGAAYSSRSGAVLVNVSNPEMRPKYEMRALMLHEGVPGHHLQKSREASVLKSGRTSAALERLRRSDAFSEGWGLYAESLGYDAGLYRDPYDRFGQLTYELIRAARMVVDTGIHGRGWSRSQAVRYFVETTGKPLAVAEGEIDRAIWDPASLVVYKAGELTLQRIKREAKATLGPEFDVRDFHEFLLQMGPLPLDLLETEFHVWLKARVGKGVKH